MPEIIVKLGDNVVHKYVFEKDIMSIGRARDNDIVIENLSVSRNHARIRKEGDRYVLTDLNSANGSYVNGVRITRVEVVDEDVITIGKHKLHFTDKPASEEEMIGEAFGAERTMLVDQLHAAMLTVSKGKQKDQKFIINKYENYIGRASDNDVRLHDWFVSKKHAVIIRQGAGFFIKDLGSWRGTMVNGKNIRDCELKENDEIQLGTTVIVFQLEGAEAPAQITGRVPHELPYEEEAAGIAAAIESGAPPEEFSDALAEAQAGEPLEAGAEAQAGAGAGAYSAESAHGREDEYSPLSEAELEAFSDEERRELGPPPEPLPVSEGELAMAGAENLADENLEKEEADFSGLSASAEEIFPAAPPGIESSEAEEAEEEAALMQGATPQPFSPSVPRPPAPAPAPSASPTTPPPAEHAYSPITAAPGTLEWEVEIWERALHNKSRIIRRQAAKKLKHLTGRDYDWESEPAS